VRATHSTPSSTMSLCLLPDRPVSGSWGGNSGRSRSQATSVRAGTPGKQIGESNEEVTSDAWWVRRAYDRPGRDAGAGSSTTIAAVATPAPVPPVRGSADALLPHTPAPRRARFRFFLHHQLAAYHCQDGIGQQRQGHKPVPGPGSRAPRRSSPTSPLASSNPSTMVAPIPDRNATAPMQATLLKAHVMRNEVV
jgi:hypothetical protein